MEIRKVSPIERIQFNGISSTVFLDTRRQDIRAQLQNPEEHIGDHEYDDNCWGAFDEKGTLHSGFIINAYDMRMNGHNVKMGGIGAVITKPESRGQGLVRKVFDHTFPIMIERGQVFSFLYPFSYEYYRNFGYDICYSYNKINIPMECIEGYKYPRNIAPHEPGDDIQPFIDMYEEFTRDRNLAIVRSRDTWEYMLNRDPYKDLKFTYLNRDENGVPNAYVLYGQQKSGEYGNRLVIRELVWRTPQGLRDIFGFFSRLNEFGVVEWNAPCDFHVHTMFPEAYDLRWSVNGCGMNRIVDVKAGLETLRAPEGSGKVVVDVTDGYWKDNTAKYQIEWDAGNLTVKKGVASEPDMAVSVQTLAQLVTGYLTPTEVALKKDTAVYGDILKLEKLFPKQRLYILERF